MDRSEGGEKKCDFLIDHESTTDAELSFADCAKMYKLRTNYSVATEYVWNR
jgi:hypothetical protein